MIIIKKKVLFIFFLIIFFINIFLISKRRDFNFYYIKSFLHNETYSQINENSNIKNEEINFELNNINLTLKKNKIKEINIDSNILKKNLNIEDIIFYFYPIKVSTGSHYVIGYFNDHKYDKCKNLGPTLPKGPILTNFFDTHLTVYTCE